MAASASTSKAPAKKAEATPTVDDAEAVPPIPSLAVSRAAWTLSQPHLSEYHAAAKETLLKGIEEDGKLIA